MARQRAARNPFLEQLPVIVPWEDEPDARLLAPAEAADRIPGWSLHRLPPGFEPEAIISRYALFRGPERVEVRRRGDDQVVIAVNQAATACGLWRRPGGETTLWANTPRGAALIDIPSGEIPATFPHHAFCADARERTDLLAVALTPLRSRRRGRTRAIRLLDLATLRWIPSNIEIPVESASSAPEVHCVGAIRADGRGVALCVRSVPSEASVWRFDPEHPPERLVEGTHASVGLDGGAWLWEWLPKRVRLRHIDLDTGAELGRLSLPGEPHPEVRQVAGTADGVVARLGKTPTTTRLIGAWHGFGPVWEIDPPDRHSWPTMPVVDPAHHRLWLSGNDRVVMARDDSGCLTVDRIALVAETEWAIRPDFAVLRRAGLLALGPPPLTGLPMASA